MKMHSAKVFLVGFSGSGKSMVGDKLARKLKVRFYDTDAMIERSRVPRISVTTTPS